MSRTIILAAEDSFVRDQGLGYTLGRQSVTGSIQGLDCLFHWCTHLFMCDTVHIRTYNVKSHWKVQGPNSTPEKISIFSDPPFACIKIFWPTLFYRKNSAPPFVIINCDKFWPYLGLNGLGFRTLVINIFFLSWNAKNQNIWCSDCVWNGSLPAVFFESADWPPKWSDTRPRLVGNSCRGQSAEYYKF